MNRPSPDDMKAMQVMDYVAELEKDNKELKEKLALTENDRDEREVKARDMMKENKKLKEKVEQMEKYQQNNRIKLKKVQGENYKLKKCIEVLKKAFPMFFDGHQQIGEPYGESMADILKENF